MSVRYELRDRVAVITIDRPEKRNAMNLEVFDGLGDAARRAADDDGAGAVLVRGEGGSFSSGIDIGFLGSQLADGEFTLDDGARLQGSFTAFEEVDKPVLAAIDGHCFGAGMQLALACHLRAVTPSASLSVMEVRWGLVPDLGGTHRLPRLVGLGRATELAVTGRQISAEESVALGIAEFAVADQEEAFTIASGLAAAPGAARRIPRLMRENLVRNRDDALADELRAQLDCVAGPDFSEAIRAHLEGREPNFVGE